MTHTAEGWSDAERRVRQLTFTKQELWAWLKAESRHRPPKEPRRVIPNRRTRRAMTINWKRTEVPNA